MLKASTNNIPNKKKTVKSILHLRYQGLVLWIINFSAHSKKSEQFL